MSKGSYICKCVDDVCEQLKKGKYVFTYVKLKSGDGIAYINAYHLCDYGLEAFSIDRNCMEFPMKLRRADVHFPDHIDNLDAMVKEHITKRSERFDGFMVCNAMLDLANIPKPTRFSAFPKETF